MEGNEDNRFLLFMEPSKEEKQTEPIEDEYVEVMERALEEAESGISHIDNMHGRPYFIKGDAYKGFHRTDCGETSDNKEYLLKNGMITNSLAPFYLRYYRDSVPASDMVKLEELEGFYSYSEEKRLEKWDSIGGFLKDIEDETDRTNMANVYEATALFMLMDTLLMTKFSEEIQDKARILMLPFMRHAYLEHGWVDPRFIYKTFASTFDGTEKDVNDDDDVNGFIDWIYSFKYLTKS